MELKTGRTGVANNLVGVEPSGRASISFEESDTTAESGIFKIRGGWEQFWSVSGLVEDGSAKEEAFAGVFGRRDRLPCMSAIDKEVLKLG